MSLNNSSETLAVRPCSICHRHCDCPDEDGLYPLRRMSVPSASASASTSSSSQQSLHGIHIQVVKARRSVAAATTVIETTNAHTASAVDIVEEDDEAEIGSSLTLIGCGDANGDDDDDDNNNHNRNAENQAPVLITQPTEPAQEQQTGTPTGTPRAATATRRVMQWLRRPRNGSS